MNKNIFNTLILIFATVFCNAQTATDFTADDCNGTTHNLYSELDAGNVVVLCWVIVVLASAWLNIQNRYNLLTFHPGKVKYYIVDDYEIQIVIIPIHGTEVINYHQMLHFLVHLLI